jgi:hypothetical protein
MRIYYRFKPELETLKEDDYITGWGINSSHYNDIQTAREKHNKENPDNLLPLREDFKEAYDARTGFNIEGKALSTRYHPLHDKVLLEISTGKRYCIDAVHIHNYFGKYMDLLVREEGSKSHGVRTWEVYTCKEPTIVNSCEENNRDYKLIDKLG